MSKYTNKPKSPQVFTTQQPTTAPTPQPQPIHDIPRPGLAVTPTPTHEDVARRAYQIYVEKGRPQGQSEEIWRQAEQDILSRGRATTLSK